MIKTIVSVVKPKKLVKSKSTFSCVAGYTFTNTKCWHKPYKCKTCNIFVCDICNPKGCPCCIYFNRLKSNQCGLKKSYSTFNF